MRAGVDGRTTLAAAWGLTRLVEPMARLDLAVRFVYAAVQPANAWWTAHWAAEAWLEWARTAGGGADEQEAAVVAHLLREVIGNPAGESEPLPSDVLAWNDGTVPRIAYSIYDDRLPDGTLDPTHLGLLHDALLDGGLDDEELLSHLRSNGPHYRGCWGVDLLLGRS